MAIFATFSRTSQNRGRFRPLFYSLVSPPRGGQRGGGVDVRGGGGAPQGGSPPGGGVFEGFLYHLSGFERGLGAKKGGATKKCLLRPPRGGAQPVSHRPRGPPEALFFAIFSIPRRGGGFPGLLTQFRGFRQILVPLNGVYFGPKTIGIRRISGGSERGGKIGGFGGVPGRGGFWGGFFS